VILLGEHAPAERQRFTIAHEIGHAVMHDDDGVDGDQERQADAFAGELLLPAACLREEWPAVPDVENLLPLKRRWGISLSALIRRANETGLLTDRDYRGWNIQLSSTGMNRREPDPLQPEQPTRLRSVIVDAQAGGATIDDLAARAHMLPREFTDTFLEGTA
jgi:Zn-dependent peptidase ImmA (M78 family)